MRVLFTSKVEGEIFSFHPYSFQEVVVLTAELDAKLKKKNAKPMMLDFMIFNDEGDKLYNGSYEVGGEGTSNIYDHVCQKLLDLPMKNKNEETKRDVFLQQLTSHTPASYQIDLTEVWKEKEGQKSSWKQLGKRGRIFVSVISTTLMVAISYIHHSLYTPKQSRQGSKSHISRDGKNGECQNGLRRVLDG